MYSPPQSPATQPLQGPEPRRRTGLLIALVVGLVVLLVLATAAVAAAFFLPGLLRGQRVAPTLLPAETQFYASINPNLSAVPGLQRLQRAYENVSGDEAGADIDQQLEDLLGVTFSEDIQPWLGIEIAFAVNGLRDLQDLESDPEAVVADTESYLLLASRDNRAAQAFLDKQRARREDENDERFAEEEHRGVMIVSSDSAESATIGSFAIVNDFVVFASDGQLIKDLIDRARSREGTLGQHQPFQQILGQLPDNAVAYSYVSGVLFEEFAELGFAQQEQTLPEDFVDYIDQQRAMLDAFQGLGLALTVPEEGVQFDAVASFDMQQLERREEWSHTIDAQLHTHISDQALGFINASIPESFRDQMLDLIDSSAELRDSVDSFERDSGLSLERDLLSWLAGDYTLVVLPGDLNSSLPVNGYLALRSTDMEAARDGLQAVADALAEVGTEFQEQRYGGVDWQIYADPYSEEVFGGYSVQDDAVLIAIGEPAMDGASEADANSINAQPDFELIQGKLYRPYSGLFYVHMPSVLDAITAYEEEFGPTFAPIGDSAELFVDTPAGEALKPILGIGAAADVGIDEQGYSRSRLFVAIAEE